MRPKKLPRKQPVRRLPRKNKVFTSDTSYGLQGNSNSLKPVACSFKSNPVMIQASADIEKEPREFLPENFVLTDWENLEPWLKNLLDRTIDSKAALEKWLKDNSELEAVLSEDACWRQIRMTCDTTDKSLEEAFVFFVTQIQPRIQPYADLLNRKLVESPFTKELDQKKYFTYLRTVRKSID